jgi:hypothetical protein
MIELMEPDTYILDPQSTELQRPDEWDSAGGIKDFLRATQDHSLKDLSVVSLLSEFSEKVTPTK